MAGSCARPVVGHLQFEEAVFVSGPTEKKSNAARWIEIFASPDFLAFSAGTNSPQDAALLKRDTLTEERQRPGVVSVRWNGPEKEGADRVTTLVAQTINAYSAERSHSERVTTHVLEK